MNGELVSFIDSGSVDTGISLSDSIKRVLDLNVMKSYLILLIVMVVHWGTNLSFLIS